MRWLVNRLWMPVCLAWLSGLATGQAAPAKLKVVTSFLPVYCLTANVAGDLAEVENLLPAGVGPHDYQFSPRDVRKLTSADLFVVNGLGVEDWLDKAVGAAGNKEKPAVVKLSDGLKQELIEDADKDDGHKHTHRHGKSANPHIWLDPQLAQHAVTNILNALTKADPANAAGYAANAEKFRARLQKLDAEIRTTLAPFKGQPVMTFHNAFPYFLRRYDLTLAGVVEEVPDVEPSPRYLAGLMKTIRDRKVKVIFTEPQFSSKLARQIAQDTGIAVAELDTLEIGPLTLSAYEDGLRRNVEALKRHLK